MTVASPYRLGIDFGTSNTVAMVQRPDGRVRPLLFDGSPLLSSAVLLGLDGHLHTGRDAAHLARSYPERLEPNPKRRIDDGSVLLGDGEVEVRDLVAAVLRRVVAEARQVAGPQGEVLLTHPVGWHTSRRSLLTDAAERAGLGRPRLAPEPVGAAMYFAQLGGDALPPDAHVLVYDLGAGTCDVTLLRRRKPGFEVVGSAGLDDVGGLDIDSAIVDFLQATYTQLWYDGASRRQLWDEVRTAKEMLSRSAGTIVAIPALGTEVPLGRGQFDELARPVLDPTVSLVAALLDRSGVGPDRIAGLYLVGGSSRIPLVGTLLHKTLGISPRVTEQPELVVAEGALSLAPAEPPGDLTPAGPSGSLAPVSPAYATPPGSPAQPVSPAYATPPGSPAHPVSPAYAAPPGSPVHARPAGAGPDADAGSPTSGSPASGAATSGAATGTGLPEQLWPAPQQPWPGVPVAATGRRRDRLVIGVAVGAVLLVLALIGGGAALADAILDGAKNGNTEDDSGFPQRSVTTDGPGAGAPPVSIKPSDKVPTKFQVADVGAGCDKIDVAPLKSVFEQQDAPSASRFPGVGYASANCIISMTHVDGTGLADSVVIVSFSLWVYEDVASAVESQRTSRDNATANKANPADEPGLGEEAFTFGKSGAAPGPTKAIESSLEVRDANLRWTAQIKADRIASNNWSQTQRGNIEKAFMAAARQSYRNVTAK